MMQIIFNTVKKLVYENPEARKQREQRTDPISVLATFALFPYEQEGSKLFWQNYAVSIQTIDPKSNYKIAKSAIRLCTKQSRNDLAIVKSSAEKVTVWHQPFSNKSYKKFLENVVLGIEELSKKSYSDVDSVVIREALAEWKNRINEMHTQFYISKGLKAIIDTIIFRISDAQSFKNLTLMQPREKNRNILAENLKKILIEMIKLDPLKDLLCMGPTEYLKNTDIEPLVNSITQELTAFIETDEFKNFIDKATDPNTTKEKTDSLVQELVLKLISKQSFSEFVSRQITQMSKLLENALKVKKLWDEKAINRFNDYIEEMRSRKEKNQDFSIPKKEAQNSINLRQELLPKIWDA